ncbi:MAG: hypothetical protein NTZ50_06555 [Chloroflexi bacterium]|nr:hypothetical protein [Chloroflexota bacterium]
MTAAPAAGAGIAEVVRRVFKRIRGQYFWLAAAVGVGLGAAVVVAGPLLALLAGRFPSLMSFLPLLGLGVLISALIARLR